MRRFTETAWFGYGITIVLCVGVVYAVYWWYAEVAMPQHDSCSAQGGIIMYDAFNVPTCVHNPSVLLAPRRF